MENTENYDSTSLAKNFMSRKLKFAKNKKQNEHNKQRKNGEATVNGANNGLTKNDKK